MRLVFVAAILASSVTPLAFAQCSIKPIKPIPPLGCRDLTPQCVSDSNGHASWTWACVPSREETSTSGFPTWKPAPRAPIPVSPSAAPSPSPQAPSTAPPPDISWVKLGMPQQDVLSGLAGRFKLGKEDVGDSLKMEIWSVESLSPSLGFSEIAFVDGKVGSIITHAAPLFQSEVSVLAQRLFADLYPRGDADNSKVGKFMGTRDLTAQIKMFQMTSEKGNEETLRFQFDDGRSFEIKINVPVKGSPAVTTTEFQAQ